MGLNTGSEAVGTVAEIAVGTEKVVVDKTGPVVETEKGFEAVVGTVVGTAVETVLAFEAEMVGCQGYRHG
jgi:hypothetical protein